ncbi:glycine-rich protein 1-like [Prunus persica]|uniref:glycine-rich protein 1-like n=1 Tax=Prunus persica TaxID=3760 RepID=UPI0009AB4221|nr:glycine-rich protein 1-like [Prunus persica]
MATEKTPTATEPARENLFKTTPLGAGASVGDPETEEGGEGAGDSGEDDGGESGESATGGVEGAAEGGVPEGEGEVLKGEGEAAGGVLKGEGAAAGGVLKGEGAEAGDCALVEATKRAAISTKTTALDWAIVEERMKTEKVMGFKRQADQD